MTRIPYIPTKAGDVLIVRTAQSFSTYAVGHVATDGAQDFGGQSNVRYLPDRASALTEAKARVIPGGRIFLVDFDKGQWSEIST